MAVEESTGGDWPALVQSLLEAGERGVHAVWEAAVSAGRRVAGADGAVVVRWDEGDVRVLLRDGAAVRVPRRRPPDGVSLIQGQPVAVAALGHRTDLIVARTADRGSFDLGALEALRAVTALAAQAGGHPRKALSALLEVATKLLAAHEIEEVFLAVANASLEVLHAEIAGVLLTDSAGEALDMRCAVGHRTVETAHLRAHRGQGLAGKVLATGQPQRVDDYVTDVSISKDFLSVASREGTQSALCAPMAAQGRTIGAVCVWRRRRSVFTSDDVRVMSALADLAAIAVQNTRLREAEQRSGIALQEAHRELEERHRDTEYALRVHRELTRSAAEEEDLHSVIRAVASLTGGSAVLVGQDFLPVAGDTGKVEQRLVRRLAKEMVSPGHAGGTRVLPPMDSGSTWTVAAPVRMAEAPLGLLCLNLDSAPRPVDEVVAAQAATVCALLLAREQSALTTMRRLQSEFVWDLLEGRIPDHTEALVRARHLRHDFSLPARVLLVQLQGMDALSRSEGWGPEELEGARGRATQLLADRVTEKVGVLPVVAHRADLLAALLPRPEEDPPAGARQLGEAVAPRWLIDGVPQRVGISAPVHTVDGFPASLRQARFSLSACTEEHPAVVFEELGVLQFLLAPAGRGDLLAFAEQTLGPLIQYDRERGTDLLGSLECYLASDCRLKPAAERAFVHHKTMRYRLRRVEELAGLCLDRQEDRFNAQLALTILRLGEEQPPT